MKQLQDVLVVRTAGRGFTDISERVQAVVAASGVGTGLCTVLCRHTSASLVITENADPAVRRDMARWLERVAPEGAGYEHAAEGPDDMPSHLRSALLRSTESVPVTGGRLALGTWQGLFLAEHRAAAHRRELVVHVIGE